MSYAKMNEKKIISIKNLFKSIYNCNTSNILCIIESFANYSPQKYIHL